MKIIIENTEKIITLKPDLLDTGVPARIWVGKTDSGIPVHVFVTRISPRIDVDDPRSEEFRKELAECKTPSPDVEAYPLRLIL